MYLIENYVETKKKKNNMNKSPDWCSVANNYIPCVRN